MKKMFIKFLMPLFLIFLYSEKIYAITPSCEEEALKIQNEYDVFDLSKDKRNFLEELNKLRKIECKAKDGSIHKATTNYTWDNKMEVAAKLHADWLSQNYPNINDLINKANACSSSGFPHIITLCSDPNDTYYSVNGELSQRVKSITGLRTFGENIAFTSESTYTLSESFSGWAGF